jgi:hypothetical protein
MENVLTPDDMKEFFAIVVKVKNLKKIGDPTRDFSDREKYILSRIYHLFSLQDKPTFDDKCFTKSYVINGLKDTHKLSYDTSDESGNDYVKREDFGPVANWLVPI